MKFFVKKVNEEVKAIWKLNDDTPKPENATEITKEEYIEIVKSHKIMRNAIKNQLRLKNKF